MDSSKSAVLKSGPAIACHPDAPVARTMTETRLASCDPQAIPSRPSYTEGRLVPYFEESNAAPVRNPVAPCSADRATDVALCELTLTMTAIAVQTRDCTSVEEREPRERSVGVVRLDLTKARVVAY